MACETLPARTSGCVRASSGGRKRTGNPLIAESCINLGASPAVAAGRPGVERVSIGRLEKNNLSSLNDLKNVLSCHFEYMGRSFFKTRNSRTLNFHVVFLMVFQFRGARLALGIAKVSFLVTYIHINLLSIIISCTCILSNKKVDLYVNENIRGHVHN